MTLREQLLRVVDENRSRYRVAQLIFDSSDDGSIRAVHNRWSRFLSSRPQKAIKNLEGDLRLLGYRLEVVEISADTGES